MPLNNTNLSELDACKNILATVKVMIQNKVSYLSIFDLIEINIKEDINFHLKHNLDDKTFIKITKIYAECIDEFSTAYSNQAESINILKDLLKELTESGNDF